MAPTSKKPKMKPGTHKMPGGKIMKNSDMKKKKGSY
jgi:hypothetical protein